MRTYVVTSRVAEVGPAMILALTEAQVSRRAHALAPVDPKDVKLKAADLGDLCLVETTRLVQFKNGEEFGVLNEDGLPKAMLQEVARGGTPAATAAKKASRKRKHDGDRKKAEAEKKRKQEAELRKQTKAEGSKAKKPSRRSRSAKKPAGLAEDDTAAKTKAGESGTQTLV